MIAGSWRLRRLRPRGVTPVSLWDRPVPGGLLWERLGLPRVETLRRQGRTDADVAGELSAALLRAAAALHAERPFDVLYVGGGLLEIDDMRAALHATEPSFRVRPSREGPFVGEQGGQALLRGAGWPDGIVVDMGQTSVKASARGRRAVRPRDLDRLPLLLIDPAKKPEISAPRREHAADLVAATVAEVLPEPPAPDAGLVLALPCPLDDDLVPGACTYGWEGDRELLGAIFRRLDALWPRGVAPEPARQALLLNDAELAAESARRELSLAPGARALCVTLGFGPGGALLEA